MDFPRGMMEFAIPAAQAHEKWFVPIEPVQYAQPDFYHTFNAYTVGALAVVALVTLAGYWVNKQFQKSDISEKMETKIRPYRDYAAGVLAFTTGLTLLITAFQGRLLASNYLLPAGLPGQILQIIEGGVGMLLMIGLFTPVAAIGILALYAATFASNPAIEPLDYINFVGIGLFLLTFARGRYSADWFLGKPILSTPEQRKWAYVALRFLTGFTLFWLGLLKWRRPDLHLALMDQYSQMNPYVLMQWVGMNIPREIYVFILAVVESTIAIFEMFGFLTRIAALALVPVFMASVFFLGAGELVGHLPILGTLFVLFVYGDDYHTNRKHDRYAAHPAVKNAVAIK